MLTVFRFLCLMLSFVMPITALKVRLQIIGAAQMSAANEEGGGSQGPSIRS